jgi:hypothetical protein
MAMIAMTPLFRGCRDMWCNAQLSRNLVFMFVGHFVTSCGHIYSTCRPGLHQDLNATSSARMWNLMNVTMAIAKQLAWNAAQLRAKLFDAGDTIIEFAVFEMHFSLHTPQELRVSDCRLPD